MKNPSSQKAGYLLIAVGQYSKIVHTHIYKMHYMQHRCTCVAEAKQRIMLSSGLCWLYFIYMLRWWQMIVMPRSQHTPTRDNCESPI